MISPKKHRIPLSTGQHLTVYEWGEPSDSTPSIIFFHATGFHARCWDGVIRYLDGLHCYAIDAIGHGTSDKPKSPHGWRDYGRDAVDVVTALKLEGAIAVGHSMGGNSVTRAAAQYPDGFSALLLVDPVILPKDFYVKEDYSIEDHFVIKRRRDWESVDEFYNRLQGRGAFAKWQDDILRDYCDYGLVPKGEGGYTLACEPEVEANIYMSSGLASNVDIYSAIEKITLPTRILRCAHFSLESDDMAKSPTNPNLVDHFKNAIDYPLEDNTHFIPMESPELVAQHIRDLLGVVE